MAVSGDNADATILKAAFFGLELKDASKWLSTQIEMESQTAISRIRLELERDDSKALANVPTCLAVLHSPPAETRRSLSETIDAMDGFDKSIVVAKPEQTEVAETNQAF